MTSFWNLFKQMWSQKQRYIYLLFVVNIFTVIFMTVLRITMPSNFSVNSDLTGYWEDTYMWLTIYFDIAFCAVTCWQNEKINLSQSWHLVAADERKTYLANVSTSMVACALFFFLQQIINGILLLPGYGLNSFIQVYRDFQLWPAHYDLMRDVLLHWLFIIMIILLIYLFVSFANFASRMITDFLPFKSTLWIRLLVIAILVVVAVYSGLIIFSHLETLIDIKRMSPHANIIWQYDPMWLDTLILFIVNLIFDSIDFWFVHSFVEPKIANY